MTEPSCAEVREAAAELALGVLPGAERAEVLAHLTRCRDCRVAVQRDAEVADALLLLTPVAEPPLGFESRVIGQRPARPRPRRRLWRLAAAAAVAVAAVGGGIAGHAFTSGRTVPAHAYLAELRAPDGRTIGQFFGSEGQPSWCSMLLRDQAAGDLGLRLVFPGGRVVALPGPHSAGGQVEWAGRVDVPLEGVRAVRVVDSRGVTRAAGAVTD